MDDLRRLRSRATLVGAPIVGFVTTEHRPARKKARAERARHSHREPEPAVVASGDAAAISGR